MTPHEMNADAPSVRVLSTWMGLKMHEGLNAMACAAAPPPGPWPAWDTGIWTGQVWNTQEAVMREVDS